jgi:hypothetical protein
MNRRNFLTAAAVAATLPATAMPAVEKSGAGGPILLTVAGAITKSNRGPLDTALDQMMVKHEVKFSRAFTFDAAGLQLLPSINIRPTLEYDSKVHTLTGPLLTTVLSATGVNLDSVVRIGLQAIDGYKANLSVAEAKSYRMIIATHIDGQPLTIGGLGPQWAICEADAIAAFKDKPLKERFALCPWGI